MNVKKVTASLVTTIILSVFTPLHAAPAPAFTPEQEAKIGKIAADYLLAHPEILVQALQKQQQQKREKCSRTPKRPVVASTLFKKDLHSLRL